MEVSTYFDSDVSLSIVLTFFDPSEVIDWTFADGAEVTMAGNITFEQTSGELPVCFLNAILSLFFLADGPLATFDGDGIIFKGAGYTLDVCNSSPSSR